MVDARPPGGASEDPSGPIPAPLPARFRPEAVIGEGGLGTVVKAYDTHLRVYVAIKTIRHNLASEDPQQYGTLRDRFRKEAIAGAQVRTSPYVVTVYDQVVDSEGNAFLVMEFMPGGTLRDRLAEGTLPPPEALRVMADAARGLRDLHNAELVHRDVKPDNIFLTADGRAKIGDLGVVQMSSTTFRTRLEYGSAQGHPGTLIYMAPEQETGMGMLPPEANQFSLGAVLFEILIGKKYKWLRPAERERLLGTLTADTAALIRKMTAADVDDRYPGMEAVLDTLADIERAATVILPPMQRQPAVPAPYMENSMAAQHLQATPVLSDVASDDDRRTVPQRTVPAPSPKVRPHLPVPQPNTASPSVSRRTVLAGFGAVIVAGGSTAGVWALTHRSPSLPYSANFAAWYQTSIPGRLRIFTDPSGEYHLQNQQRDRGEYIATPDRLVVADFTLTVDARLATESANGAYGVVFRVQPTRAGDAYGQHYTFALFSDGSFLLNLLNGDGTLTTLQERKFTAAITMGGAVNHIKLECHGSIIVPSCNGITLGTYQGPVTTPGEIGLEVGNAGPGETVEAAYKYLYITSFS